MAARRLRNPARGVTTARAIGRSLRTYDAPGRAARLDDFHRRFLGPGDLAFDIGAHVGDRAASSAGSAPGWWRWSRSRASPGCCACCSAGCRDGAVPPRGAAPGEAALRLNTANPTVATASPDFIAAADGAPGWEGQRWDAEITLPVTTLDALAAAHGRRADQIDVEGHKAAALAGLTFAPRTLSFHFTTIQRDVAFACLDRLAGLGYRAFNACLGEGMAFAHPAPLEAAGMAAWIAALPAEANSGDVYACAEPARITPAAPPA